MPLRTTLLTFTLAAATAVATCGLTTSQAHAESSGLSAAAIAAAVPDDEPKTIVPSKGPTAFIAKKDGLSVTIPFDSKAMIEMKAAGAAESPAAQQGPTVQNTGATAELGSPGDSVGIGLPATKFPTFPTVSADGTVTHVDKLGPADVAVQALDDGSVRAMVVVKKPTAPTRYWFSVRLPAGGSLAADGDGGVLLYGAQGEAIGAIAAPWATDANGVAVPTRYIIEGNTIVQEVSHQGAVYPVVSDPKVSLCFHWGVRVCVKFNKAETKRIAGVMETVGVREGIAALCTAIPGGPLTFPIKAACAAIIAAWYNSIKNTFVSAKKKGKCVRMRFTTAPVVPTSWNVVNC